MYKKLTTVPRIVNDKNQKDTLEWQIPQQISVVFTFLDNFGFTFMAKVRVEKKHWWNRSWQTFTAHDTDAASAIAKGNALLERYGYTIDQNSVKFAG